MSNIKVGDLVMVVRLRSMPCKCVSSKSLGLIFRVDSVHEWDNTKCHACGIRFDQPAVLCYPEQSISGFAKNRLKRIPPLNELEGEKEKKEIHERA